MAALTRGPGGRASARGLGGGPWPGALGEGLGQGSWGRALAKGLGGGPGPGVWPGGGPWQRALGEGLARGLGFGQGAWGGGHSLLLPAPQDFLGKTDPGNKTIDKLA